MPAIEIKGLTKKFGEKTAVLPFDLTIEEGELFGLLGVNGAGKTTIVRMLSCLTKPTGGEALLCGQSILTDSERVKALTNVSPQETAVAPNLTVIENLELLAGLYGAGREEARRAAREAVGEFSLYEVENTRAAILSGGWQRRLSIALALITKPKILFLDEPTLGLDVLARRELWKIIRAQKGRVTMTLTTHYLEEAETLCDRVAVMAAGRVMAVGTPAELKARAGTDSFEEAFIKMVTGAEA